MAEKEKARTVAGLLRMLPPAPTQRGRPRRARLQYQGDAAATDVVEHIRGQFHDLLFVLDENPVFLNQLDRLLHCCLR